jgi:hypothetical protein
LWTGAGCIGIEIQPALAEATRARALQLNLSRVCVVEGDAAELVRFMTIGTVFFAYCPFSGERLRRVLGDLERIARAHPIRICCVDLPSLELPWVAPVGSPRAGLAVYRSRPS